MSDITLNFFSLQDETSFQLPGKTTISEMKEKYSKEKKIPLKDFGITIFLIYNGLKLDLNSKEKISQKFKDKDTIFIIKKGEDINIDKISEPRKNKVATESKKIDNKITSKNNIFNKNNIISNKNSNADKKNIINDNKKNDNAKKPNIQKKNCPNDNIDKIKNSKNKNNNTINNVINKDKKECIQKIISIDDYILIKMVKLSFERKQIIEFEKMQTPNRFFAINEALRNQNSQFFILGIMAKYLEKIGIIVVIDKTNYYIDNIYEYEKEMEYNINLLQFICNGYILKYKYILDFGLKYKRIQQLIYDIKEQVEFNKKLKDIFIKEYKLKKDEFVITNLEISLDKYSAIVIIKSNFSKDIKKDDLINLFKNDDELSTFIDIQKEILIPVIRLSTSILDPRGDNKNDKNWGMGEIRGGEKYYPPVGWIKYGLRVDGCFDNKDNSWLGFSNKSGEWCIAYCGLAGISKYREDIYENDDDIRHVKKKVGIGINCFQKPELIYTSSEEINANEIKYKLGIMVRVKPDAIRCSEKNKLLWIANGNDEEIRPYGILIIKV